MKIGEKLQLLRKQYNFSQEDMANQLSMSTKGYGKIERGETRANLPRLEQISEIFNMDICELLSYGEDGSVYINNTDNNLTNSNISLCNGSSEMDKLQLIIAHKDEIISNKDEIILSLKKEIELLKEINSVISKKV